MAGRGCILSLFYIRPQRAFDSLRLFGVVSYLYSTSDHNIRPIQRPAAVLYLISILHQTTTQRQLSSFSTGCILSLFYIRPQRRWRKGLLYVRCILSLFYIRPQRAALNFLRVERCILSLFYIRPQPTLFRFVLPECCILSLFYIRPQPTSSRLP